ncbi:MAG: DUF1700 domain-containing protein [Eubacteriales bacterium]|nr:DUF1700 domain-containing protein [Eubacteriales bacterium]
MTKNDFLKELENSLKGNVSEYTLREQINYYRDYITTEVASGKEEKDVLNELGDPKLIAKTIIQVHPSEKNFSEESEEVHNLNNEEYSNNGYNGEENNTSSNRAFYTNANPLGCLITSIVLSIVFSFLLRLFFGVGSFFVGGILGIFGPFLGWIIIFVIIYNIFFRRR